MLKNWKKKKEKRIVAKRAILNFWTFCQGNDKVAHKGHAANSKKVQNVSQLQNL